MLIIQINTKNDTNAEALKESLEIILNHENIALYEGEEFVIKKKIPVYSTEELTRLAKANSNFGIKPAAVKKEPGIWEKRHRYSNIWHFCCSRCGKTSPQSQYDKPQYAFCPYCGEKMQIPKEVKKCD